MMVRRILEGKESLPPAIAETIKAAVGADRKALEATIIVGLLQARQGDKDWAKLLWERGYGKMPDKIIGDADQPTARPLTLKIDNSWARWSTSTSGRNSSLMTMALETTMTLVDLQGKLATSDHPLHYIANVAMPISAVLGSWIPLQILNRIALRFAH
jgi:hypothetical protein